MLKKAADRMALRYGVFSKGGDTGIGIEITNQKILQAGGNPIVTPFAGVVAERVDGNDEIAFGDFARSFFGEDLGPIDTFLGLNLKREEGET